MTGAKMTRAEEAKVREQMRRYQTASCQTDATHAGLRCGLSDAAHLCDAIARDLMTEHRGRDGKGATTKRGNELAAIAKRCGDAIWAMHEAACLALSAQENESAPANGEGGR